MIPGLEPLPDNNHNFFSTAIANHISGDASSTSTQALAARLVYTFYFGNSMAPCKAYVCVYIVFNSHDKFSHFAMFMHIA